MTINKFINLFKHTYNSSDKLLRYLPLIKNYNFSNWEKYIKTCHDTYYRNLVFKNNDFEILVISWLPGQKTPIHSHPQNGCIMKILDGQLCETKITKDNKSITNYIKNDTSYIHDSIGKHVISNESDNLAVSLHIYSPPNFYNNK